MVDNDAPYKAQHFLDTVLQKSGIGKKKAALLAGRFESLGSFKDADFGSLELQSPEGRRVTITEGDLTKINKAKDRVHPEQSLVENWIKFTSHNTTRKIIENVRGLTLDHINMNPFLIRMLHLRTPEELLRFNVYQTVSRSIVTSMGTSLEYMVADCGGRRGRRGEWYDVVKEDAEDTYWVQVKSGPNNIDKDQMIAFNNNFNETAKTPRQHPRLGITYGKPGLRTISLQMAEKYLDDWESRLLVGRELWDFMSGETNYHEKILSWIDEAVSEDLKNQSIDSKIQDAISRIASEFKSKYGDGEEAVQRYIDAIL